jgi:hypothetical protein
MSFKENMNKRITVTVRQGRRRKLLPDELKEKRGCWKLEEEALAWYEAVNLS